MNHLLNVVVILIHIMHLYKVSEAFMPVLKSPLSLASVPFRQFPESAFALRKSSHHISYLSNRHVVRHSSTLPASSNTYTEQASLSNKLSESQRETKVRTKIRQHVNPLQSRYQVPIELKEDWVESMFPTKHASPFVVDVGTGKGNWALNYGMTHPETNVLGLEIRAPAVELARDRAQRLNVTNVGYLACNANVDISRILNDIHKISRVSIVTIQFPDPHFKKKQKKRRLVNPLFVSALAKGLTAGAEVFFQSDVEDLVIDANQCFSHCEDFARNPLFDSSDFRRNENPLKIMTDREISVVQRDEPVYRISYIRRSHN